VTASGIQGLRVLVVEDEGLIAIMFEDMLMDMGCAAIRLARDADEALRIVENEDFDAALLDVNLGRGKTSYPIADALTRRGTPFAFLTGYGEVGIRDGYRERPVLSKPIDQARFMKTLEKLAGEAKGEG
jgi:CheY-like chemotaxis protein